MRGVNHTGYLEDTRTVFKGKHSSKSCCRQDCKQDGSNKDKVGQEGIDYSLLVYAKVSHGPRGTPQHRPPQKNLLSLQTTLEGKFTNTFTFPQLLNIQIIFQCVMNNKSTIKYRY